MITFKIYIFTRFTKYLTCTFSFAKKYKSNKKFVHYIQTLVDSDMLNQYE